MRLRFLIGLSVLTAATLPGAAIGAVMYDVLVNTAPLMSSAAGPFSLDFQFIDGSGSGDDNNSVTLSNFNFDSGAPTGSPAIFGSATGDLTSSLTLTDSTFFNEFTQTFTPGPTLGFTINLTSNLDLGGVPDEFSFGILDGAGAGNAMLIADINSSSPSLLAYPSDSLSLQAPLITPEPGSAWLLAGGFLAVVLRARSSAKTVTGRG